MRQLKCKIAEQFRHLLMQVDKNSVDIEILLDLETKKTVRLKELIPDWWGYIWAQQFIIQIHVSHIQLQFKIVFQYIISELLV